MKPVHTLLPELFIPLAIIAFCLLVMLVGTGLVYLLAHFIVGACFGWIFVMAFVRYYDAKNP